MKTTVYALQSFKTDIRENIRVLIFSMVFVFVCLFYLSDNLYYRQNISLLDGLEDTYYCTMNDSSLTYEQLSEKISMYGKSHFATHRLVTCGGTDVDCFIYDEYICEHMNYNFWSGSDIKNENEVILTYDYRDEYKVGDKIVFAYYDENNKVCKFEKVVCGILDKNTVYYPNGVGSDDMELLYVECDDYSYTRKSIITTDLALANMPTEGIMMFMFEPVDGFDRQAFESIMDEVGDCYQGDAVIADNKRNLNAGRTKDRILVIAGGVIGISSFLGSIYISTIRRRKEKGILLLCGATKFESRTIVIANSLLSNIVGAILGVVAATQCIKFEIFEGKLSLRHYILAIIVDLLIFIISGLIIDKCHRKENIVELLRKEI